MNVGARAINLEIVGKRHKAQHLVGSQTPHSLCPVRGADVLPVERTYPRAGLSLERGRGTIWVKAEQERPVTTSPLEVVSSAVPVRMPEVVLPRWDLRGQLPILSVDNLIVGRRH